VAGIAVKKTGKYLIPTYIGWMFIISWCRPPDDTTAQTAVLPSLSASNLSSVAGIGIIYVVTLFPILASIPVTQTAPAMALYVFSRNFGYVSLLPFCPCLLAQRALIDLLNIDLGCHCWWCHHSERAKEKVARFFPCAVPTGRRDRFRDDSYIPSLEQPLKDAGAGHVWMRSKSSGSSCLASRLRVSFAV
jgi:hypothetical protein